MAAITIRADALNDGNTYTGTVVEIDPGGGLSPVASVSAPFGVPLRQGAIVTAGGIRYRLASGQDRHDLGLREFTAFRLA